MKETNIQESKQPKRVWKWCLILVLVYYTILYTLYFTTQIEVPLLVASVAWALFNVGIFIVVINSEIEKKVLLIPAIAIFSMYGFAVVFNLGLDGIAYALSVYLLMRKSPPAG